MANRTQKITLLNDRGIMGDNNPRLPDPSKIDYGQLAINYSKSKETLAIKNDNDEIVQFKDIKYIESIINNTVGSIQGGETDSIKTVITDKVITSDLKLSSTIDNMVVINPDGVYVTLDLTYNQGELVISGSNGLKKSVNLPLESFLSDGQYYESYTYNGVVYKQVIVLTVRNEAGEEHPIIIPAGSLVNVYTFYGDGKGLVVTVTPSGSGDSNDYDVQITLKINPSSSNILVNDVNGLYVEDFRPYIAKAKQEAIDTAHQDAVNMDNIVIKHCEKFATQEAQDAYDRATQFFLEWSNQILHITGGTMLGPIVFVNSGSTVGGTIYHDGTINQYLSGATTEYNSGSTLHIKDGTNVIFDCGVEIEWCGEIIDKDTIDQWNDMMPKSGGTFYGPVIYGERTIDGVKHVSSNTFASGTTNTFANGSVENYNNGSQINHNNNSNENYKSGATVTYESGSQIDHANGSNENHKSGSIDTYEAGSIVNFSGSTNFKSGSTTTFESGSILNHNSGATENYASGSTTNHNSGSNDNYKSGSTLTHESGSNENHNSGSTDTYLSGSSLVHAGGSTEDYNSGAIENYNTGSQINHNSGSNDNYKNGSTLTHESGSTENYGAGSTTNVSGSTNYKSGSTLTHESGSTENYNAGSITNISGSTNFKSGSTTTFESGSTINHNSGATDTFKQGSTVNFQGASVHNNTSTDVYGTGSQLTHQNGSVESYESGSQLTHKDGTKENHESGSTDTYEPGSIVNFSGNTINNNDTSINNVDVTETYNSGSTISNSGVTNYQSGSTINHNNGSTETFNSGSTLHVKSGTTVTFDCGVDINWCSETLDENKIKKWDTTTQSAGFNTTNGAYIPSSERFTSGATTVLSATTLLDKAIQTVITSAGFNNDGTYNKPNSGKTGSYVSGSTSVKGALEGLDNHAVNVNNSIGLNQNGTMPSFTGNYTSGATNIIDAINKLDTEIKRFETEAGNKYMPYSGGTFVGGVTASTAAPFVFSGTVTTQNTVTINSGETVNGTITANGTLNFPNTGNNITGKGSARFEQGGFQDYSDIRLKENIKDLDITLDQIQSLSLIYFNYIGKEKENIGVIAQQVKEICPQIVYEDENGMFAVDYKFLSVIALKGVQLLTSKLMEQENDIKQIKELLKIK